MTKKLMDSESQVQLNSRKWIGNTNNNSDIGYCDPEWFELEIQPSTGPYNPTDNEDKTED